MKTDIKTQAHYDAIINEMWPKLFTRGWYHDGTFNVYDENGYKKDNKRIYRNDKRPGIVVGINENARTIEFEAPISYEELCYFSRIGLAGGFDDE